MFWNLRKGLYRINQRVTKLVLVRLNFGEQDLLSGIGSVIELPKKIKADGFKKVLVVTDKGLMNLGLLDGLFASLKENKVEYAIYDGVQPNPTIQNIEDTVKTYKKNNCEAIIAFGGGSSMDCAKGAGARISNPTKTISDLRGYFKVKKALPHFYAVATTAGTGSETTIAAVVTDPSTHEKFAIADTKLLPNVAVLDPELMVGLPPHITSTTGMDALTHAVEAYVGRFGTKFTDDMAEKAVEMIFENLETVYKDGKNIEAREQMALAAYYGGASFTRAYVGYVHAIAHNLGGLYGVPHGLANAVVLPYILEYFGKSAESKLAKLAVFGKIGKSTESEEVLAKRFIEHVKTMNKNMNIPSTIKEIKEEDVSLIAERAIKEGNPTYPVPKIMSKAECEEIVRKLIVK